MLSASHDEQFTEFVSARLPAFRRVAYLLCQDWHQADDIVQAAITRLYVHWGRVSAMEHAEAYVRAILARAFLSQQRSGWVRRVILSDQVPESLACGPDREAALDLKAALAGLPPRQRATLVLRFYCDMTVEQTAEALGCTQGTVKSQTSKGLGSLRRALEPRQPEEITSYG
jgi:RNA polymerase sigma-70 factor (sigma-E family)